MKTMVTLVASFCIAAGTLSADAIQLDNGDTINGKVSSVTEKEVTIDSPIHGKLKIERKRVLAIVLGSGKPAGAAPAGAAPAQGYQKGETPADIVRRLVAKDFNAAKVRELSKGKTPAANPGDVVDQLRREGVDPALMNQLKTMLPGFSSPEVQKYFNDTVAGLQTGRISLSDIRKDAAKARDQLKDLQKDLGPSGVALDGYLGILEGFLNKTDSIKDDEIELPTLPGNRKTPKKSKPGK